MPVAPMGEPRTLEGRVDRMTMEDVETETNSGTPWQGKRLASVFIIVISVFFTITINVSNSYFDAT